MRKKASGTFVLIMAVALVLGGLAACTTSDSDTPAEPSRALFSGGNAVINGTYLFDFDRGTGGVVPVPAGDVADVWWERMTLTTSQLVPQNGARFAVRGVVDFDALTWEKVRDTAKSAGPILYTNLNVGTVVVFETDAGRMGKFVINLFSGNQDMSIAWKTWE